MKYEDVAKYIINRSLDKKKPINNLALNKILYILHTLTGILDDPNFTYTEYGPAIMDIYKKFALGALPNYRRQDCEIVLTIKHDKIIDKCLQKSTNELIKMCKNITSECYEFAIT